MKNYIRWVLAATSVCFASHGQAATQTTLDEANLSGSTGATAYYQFMVPNGATNLQVSINGGSGDADLYLRYGSQPTSSSYDCRPWESGNDESCNVSAPQEGVYYVGIAAYASYSSLSLSASYDTSSGNTGGGGGTDDSLLVTGISGAQNSQQLFAFDVPEGADNLNFTLDNAAGDADLYIRFGEAPTLNAFDCRSWVLGTNESCSISAVQAGTYYVLVHGYSQFTNAVLTGEYDASGTGGGGTGGGTGGGGTGGGGSTTTVSAVDESNLSGASGSQQFFTVDIPAGGSDLTVTMSGGSGDADLYVLYGSNPSQSAYDCRPWLNGNNESCTINSLQQGTYHIGVFAYSTFSGVSLTANYTSTEGGGSGGGGNSADLAQRLAYIDSYIYSYLPLNQKFHRPFYARQVTIRLMLRALYGENPFIDENSLDCNGCFGGVYYDDYLINASTSLIGGYGVVLDYDPRPVITQITDNIEAIYSYSINDIVSYFDGFYSGSKIAFLPERDANGNFLELPDDYKTSWLLRWTSGGLGGGSGGSGSIPGYPRVIILDGRQVIQEFPGGPYYPF